MAKEQVVQETRELTAKDLEGQDRITRLGANYYMGCHCGNFQVTKDEHGEVNKFRAEHMENCSVEE